MHNAALKAVAWPGEYVECPVESNSRGQSVHELSDISDLQAGIKNWQDKNKLTDGFNVTMPFKSKVYVWIQNNGGHIEGTSDFIAHAMHVINTVKMEGKRPIGHNTDRAGFLVPLKKLSLEGTSAIVLGAGGAARSVGVALGLDSKVRKITIWNRTPDNAKDTANALSSVFKFVDCKTELRTSDDLKSLAGEENALWVNATSMGQQGKDDVPPEVLERLKPSSVVYDIVYEPRQTRLIQEARKRGCRTITGDEMLAGQGAEAFRIWTGKDKALDGTPILNVMKKALDEHFAQHAS